MNQWLAQAIGAAAVLLSGLIYLQKKRSAIILTKLATDVLWVINLLLLGGYTGAALNAIAIARESVFYHRERRAWADSRIWLYVFLALTMISPVMEWRVKDAVTLLPMLPAVGSMVAVVSFFVKKTHTMRTLGYIAQMLWFGYNIGVRNYAGLAANVLMISAALIGNWREERAAREEAR